MIFSSVNPWLGAVPPKLSCAKGWFGWILLKCIFWFRRFGIWPKFCISNELPGNMLPEPLLKQHDYRECIAKSLAPLLRTYYFLVPKGIWYRNGRLHSFCFKKVPLSVCCPYLKVLVAVTSRAVFVWMSLILQISCWLIQLFSNN